MGGRGGQGQFGFMGPFRRRHAHEQPAASPHGSPHGRPSGPEKADEPAGTWRSHQRRAH